MEKLAHILHHAQIKRIVKTESFIFQVTNFIRIRLLVMGKIIEDVRDHLTELNEIEEEFHHLDRIRMRRRAMYNNGGQKEYNVLLAESLDKQRGEKSSHQVIGRISNPKEKEENVEVLVVVSNAVVNQNIVMIKAHHTLVTPTRKGRREREK